MPIEGALIMIVLLSIPIVAIIGATWKSVRQREYLHKERLMAIEKGLASPLSFDNGPEELVRRRPRSGVVIHGIVWTGVGLGFLTGLATAAQVTSSDDFRKFAAVMQLWAFPAFFVGIGLLVYAWLSRDRTAKARE